MKNLQSFFSRLTGLSSENYQECTKDFQNKLFVLGIALVFVPLISATLVSTSLTLFAFEAKWLFLPVFMTWFLCMYLLERSLVVGYKSKRLSIFRILTIIGVTIFHMLLFETFLFEKDILVLFNEDRQKTIQEIKSRFVGDVEEINNQIEALNDRNILLRNGFLTALKDLENEADGTGGSKQIGINKIYIEKNIKVGIANEHRTKEITENTQTIKTLKDKLLIIDMDVSNQVAALPEWSEVGLLNRLILLSRLMNNKHHLYILLFSIVWVIVFILLEGLPMIIRMAISMDEYNAIQEVRTSKNVAHLVEQITKMYDIKIEALVYRKTQELKRMEIAFETAILVNTMEAIKEKLNMELTTLEQLQLQSESSEELTGDTFKRLAKDAIDRAIHGVEEYFEELWRGTAKENYAV